MEEVWAQIKGFEGIYEVSTLGRIKSLDRPRLGHGGSIYTQKGIILKQFKENDCMRCSLSKFGIKQKIRIPTVVLETFNCPKPNGMIACHNNGDLTDNRLCNLRWATRKKNPKYGGPKLKLTEAQAIAILESTKTHEQTAKDFGVCTTTVTNIKSGRTWPHLQVKMTEAQQA